MGDEQMASPLRVVTTLPPEVEPYATEIQRFIDAMIYKLARNAHKGKWESLSFREAVDLLEKEVEELKEAIQGGNMVEVLLESADVGNFALIVSSMAIEKRRRTP